MKITTISGDMAVKLGLAIGAAFLLYTVTKKAGEAIGTTFDAVGDVLGDVADVVNPASPQNAVNQAVTAVGNATVSQDGPGRNADGSWTLGGWFYDVLHGDQINYRITGKPPKF